MKNFIAISSLLLLVCGCTISNSTHSFVHYGSDSLRDDSDFFYVKHGISGSSSAIWNKRGGGNVRSGLIADAKSDMLQQHILGPNQTYINMSIDIIRTEEGQGSDINSVTITVVVSADIIEYGLPPENYEPIVQSAKLLPTDNSSNSELPDNTGVSGKSASSNLKYTLWESVIYTKGEVQYVAEVIKDYSHGKYRIRYTLESGETKEKSVSPSSLSKSHH